MPVVNHVVPCMCNLTDNTNNNNKNENEGVNNNANSRQKNTNEYDDSKASLKNKESESIIYVTEEKNELGKKVHSVERDSKIFERVIDETVVKNIFFNKDISKTTARIEVNVKHKEYLRNDSILCTEYVKNKCKEESDRDIKNYSFGERKRDKINKSKWRLSSGVLVTLVILNVTRQGVAVEVVTTNTLASLLGYEGSCWLGAEERPCTLAFACWLRGGTSVRGCGGWLFACCQHSQTQTGPSSDWQYKVSPPRLKQVPQRNVMPNNVFRRRVDDDVTQTDCGVPSNRILQKRIIGGREARFAEFPWQAHVRISEFQCGGVLVSQWYVATAAHCVSRAHIRDIVVWLGALDTSAGSRTARKVGVHQKILHPLFQFRMTQPDRFDIALLKLSRPVVFSRHIRAICLPDSAMPLRGRSAVIAGWGKTDATDTHTGTNMLRSATVPILSKEQCIAWHQSKQISVEIHSEMICAGHSDGHQDACLGDSGGPLIVPDSGRYYLVGITSAGFGCGVDHQPGIYHNVQVTASWIRRVLNRESTVDQDTLNRGDSGYYDRRVLNTVDQDNLNQDTRYYGRDSSSYYDRNTV